MNDPIVISLLFFILIREIFFQLTVQRLVNKLMSRNYHEYVAADKIHEKESYRYNLEENESLQDLGPLGDFKP